MHEFAHFTSGYEDNTRDFENILTEMIGYLMNDTLNKKETSNCAKKQKSIFSRIFNTI